MITLRSLQYIPTITADVMTPCHTNQNTQEVMYKYERFLNWTRQNKCANFLHFFNVAFNKGTNRQTDVHI